jgi:hypothetical protein
LTDRSPMDAWTTEDLEFLTSLKTPFGIQSFLDTLPYSEDPIYRSPLRVLRDEKAHCFDGALFGAAALRALGHKPMIIELIAVRDDDHLLALYKMKGYLGAVSKSNFSGLRFREPVFKTLRELVLSYFESYFNVNREKTLRAYTAPLNLSQFDSLNWMTREDGLEIIPDKLDRIQKRQIVTPDTAANLSPVDDRTYRAGMLGANQAGLCRPKAER